MNYTEKLKLRKPEGGEYYSVEDFNGNADLIDAAVNAKVNKPTEYVAGNLAIISASGNIEDSGKKPADYAVAEHNHDAAYAPSAHISNVAIHVSEDEKAAIVAVEKKADKSYVDSALSAKADLKSPAFTETATLNGKAIVTAESGTWTPRLFGSTNEGDFVVNPENTTCKSTKINNVVILTFFIDGTLTGATGLLRLDGLPYIPKNFCANGAIGWASGLEATGVSNSQTRLTIDITRNGKLVNAGTISGRLMFSGNLIYEI